MEKLISLTKEFYTHKKLNLSLSEFKITYSNFFYNISIVSNNGNLLNLFFNWKAGLLGEYIFKKQHRNMIDSQNQLKNILLSNGYSITVINKN